MAYGNDGKNGSDGNEESVTYSAFKPVEDSNPTLTAI